VSSYDLEQAAWSRFKLSGYGFPKNKSSGCGTVEKYLSPSTRLCSVCLLSAALGSNSPICYFRFSLFSTIWGFCFSLNANLNCLKTSGFGTVMAQREHLLFAVVKLQNSRPAELPSVCSQ
jgi:hypothetical protein